MGSLLRNKTNCFPYPAYSNSLSFLAPLDFKTNFPLFSLKDSISSVVIIGFRFNSDLLALNAPAKMRSLFIVSSLTTLKSNLSFNFSIPRLSIIDSVIEIPS